MAAGCHGTVRSMFCCLCRNLVLARVHEVVLVFVACRRRLVQWEVVLWGRVMNTYVRGRNLKTCSFFSEARNVTKQTHAIAIPFIRVFFSVTPNNWHSWLNGRRT